MRTLSFTLDDFLEQLGQVRQLGPLDELLGMLPGANKIKGLKNAQVDEKQIGHIEAIIEVPDTYSADRLDQLIREITMKVLQEYHVILTAIGVYSVNTKDEEIIRTREQVREIVFAHPHVLQMHGFYLVKEPKSMRFDIVVSFDAKNRREVYAAVISDVRKAFPDYQLQVAMDTDFAEE